MRLRCSPFVFIGCLFLLLLVVGPGTNSFFVFGQDEVSYSHADMAHQPIEEHHQYEEETAHHSFQPHTELQPPGSVIHHIDAQPQQHHTDYEQQHHNTNDYEPQHHQEQHQVEHQPEHHDLTQQHQPVEHEWTHQPEHQPEHQVNHQPEHQVEHQPELHEIQVAPLEHHEGVQVAKAPEHNVLTLTCPSSEGLIHVLDTSFGQGQGSFDPSTGIIHKGYCHTPIDVSTHGCLGTATCNMVINTQTAHGVDPCPGIFKRAVVTFKCSHDTIPTDIHPTDLAHSPSFDLHEFLAPPSVVHGGLDSLTEPPSQAAFFHHFFQTQQTTHFPFPDGEECEADAHRLCGGILKNCIGDFGCTTQCITDHAPHLSPACLDKHPCFPDIDTYCKDVQGGANMIMHCLKENVAHLSHMCTSLHPCLLDASCTAIDYDSPTVHPQSPIFKHIPAYMDMLRLARSSEHGSIEQQTTPFMHLVLPTLVRGENHPSYQTGQVNMEHVARVPGQEYVQQHSTQHQEYDHAGVPIDVTHPQYQHQQQQQQQQQQPPFHHADEHLTENHPPPEHYLQHQQQDQQQHQPAVVHHESVGSTETVAVEGADEDVPNESNPTFDKSTLGTGHFSHILLQSSSEHAIDVHTKGLPPLDGFEVSLWEFRHTRNQMFDLNHFGQIFWIHEGEDHRHYCLTAHPRHAHQIVSELCIHNSPDDGITLSEEGHAQVWSYQESQIHHISTGKCLEVQGLEHTGPNNGNALFLVDCATHHPAQQWSWESGALAEHNVRIFDEHHAAVMAHNAAHSGETLNKESSDYIHEQTLAGHEAASLAEEDHHALEELRSETHQLERKESDDHLEQQRLEEHEESEIHHLQEEVNELHQRENAEHEQLQHEQQELNEEREMIHHEEERLREDETRLEHLEKEYHDRVHHHQADTEHHSVEEEEGEELHSHSIHGASDGFTEEPVHFFTPVTLILSVMLIAIFAYVFRVYLCPFFVKRYATQKPSHYYSHAY